MEFRFLFLFVRHISGQVIIFWKLKSSNFHQTSSCYYKSKCKYKNVWRVYQQMKNVKKLKNVPIHLKLKIYCSVHFSLLMTCANSLYCLQKSALYCHCIYYNSQYATESHLNCVPNCKISKYDQFSTFSL